MFFAYAQMYFFMNLSLSMCLNVFSQERAKGFATGCGQKKSIGWNYKAESDDFSQICHFRLSCTQCYFQHPFRIREERSSWGLSSQTFSLKNPCGPRECHASRNKVQTEQQVSYINAYMGIQKNDTDDFICKVNRHTH